MKISLRQQEYSKNPCTNTWNKKDLAVMWLKAMAVVGILSYFFYKSVWAIFPMAIVGLAYFKTLLIKRQKLEKEKLVVQFRECILSVAASLKAGYAIENAFLESRNDMRMLYGEQSLIYQELELIRRGLIINITLEELLNHLADRSDSEEIIQFAQIFSIAKRSGGNIAEIIQDTAELIGQRIETKQEISTMLSGRQMEQNVMKAMPFAILFYIDISYPGYFEVLYHNWQGTLLMTGCLGIYLAAYVLGNKIMNQIETELVGG